MNSKHPARHLTVIERLIVAALALGLVATGVAAVGFGVSGMFASLRLS
jgi:hypothetical protein